MRHTAISITLSLIVIVLGCKNETSGENEKSEKVNELNAQAKVINSEYTGKEVIFPSGAMDINENSLSGRLPKIVVYYDVSCSVCLEQLARWKAELEEFQATAKAVTFRFVLHAADPLALKAHLQGIEFPIQYVIIDTRNEFAGRYPFVKEGAFNSFLVSEANKIEFIGSPLVSQRIKEIYLEKLRGS